MANTEHLKILKQGVETWNPWRRVHPNIVPDLGEANLRGANLDGADLTGAHLRGASLMETDLSRAKLGGAGFEG